MCYHGIYKFVNVINQQQNRRVKVDACIADELQELNDRGIVTLGSCCGHGQAGKIVEWENAFGHWKGYAPPPTALIRKESVETARQLGYHPYPFYYADGESDEIWQMQLKTGCITVEDCNNWHNQDVSQRE